jgi:hypothetical protein
LEISDFGGLVIIDRFGYDEEQCDQIPVIDDMEVASIQNAFWIRQQWTPNKVLIIKLMVMLRMRVMMRRKLNNISLIKILTTYF